MISFKKDPVWVTKICFILLIGAFALSFATAAFGPAAQAQTAAASGGPSYLNPDLPIPGTENGQIKKISVPTFAKSIVDTTGISAFINDAKELFTPSGERVMVYGWKELIMVIVGFVIVWLGAAKGFEPLLLIPIGFGTIFVNIPLAGIGSPGVWNEAKKLFEHQGFLDIIYKSGVGNEFFPLFIFMGIGAMTDFGPLIANPKTALLGAAAQFGVFGTLFGVTAMNLLPGVNFNIKEACAVAIIGGADGPTAIFLSSKLAPNLMGAIAVSAYSYMALVPIIQPPFMRLLTTKKERVIRMKPPRVVSSTEKIIFPIIGLLLTCILVPSGLPLLGMLFFGNLLKESGVTRRLAETARGPLIDTITILLGVTVGASTQASEFLTVSSILIFGLGALSFVIATCAGVLFVKFFNLFLREGNKINPLIGNAGVSAVPDSARISQTVGLEYDSRNYLLMHAMGPNVAGVIGSAVAAGILLGFLG